MIRIEICSPGILPDSVTEDSIKEGISKPRNQLLFDNAKYLLPYTGIGSGIIRAMKSYNHITFENSYTKEEFVVTVHRREIDEESVQDKPKSVSDGVHVYEEKILAFSVTAKSRKEIMDLIGLSTHSDNYERYMLPLLKTGLLAMTLPGKPNSKNQKYITTEQGKKLLIRAERQQ
ncbi:hypothetical protein EZS27_024140 [termite gut metagenome]|uniref:Filamentation induced by cAMP protein Fic-like C-terminal domain-containing protein n=1 Tax=termite gut metagenome TaxID=433724 RepID=A0A5J4QYP3_9ZZZZ